TRIYEEPIFIDEDKTTRRSDHANKIGDRRFRLFVIKDLHPKYSYAKSVSGKIELSNLNIVEAKYLFRDWVFNVSGINYAIHSTNSIAEFYYQVPLILGIDIF